MAITHTFVCAIADDATAAANGEVVPSNWNADHAVTNLVLTHGTIATDVNTLGATVTWNAAGVTFTGIKLNVTNTASNADSLLQDWQVGGVSKASMRVDGTLKATLGNSISAPRIIPDNNNTIYINSATSGYDPMVYIYASGGGKRIALASDLQFGWSSSTADTTIDVGLWRDAAAILALDRKSVV